MQDVGTSAMQYSAFVYVSIYFYIVSVPFTHIVSEMNNFLTVSWYWIKKEYTYNIVKTLIRKDIRFSREPSWLIFILAWMVYMDSNGTT